MPWEKTYCETDVLDRAMRAFWAHGYEGTSMAEIVKATGLNRGSIYTAFSDKRALFIRALEHYDENYCARLLHDLQSSHPPKEAIIATFEACADAGPDTPGGCLIVNTALEMAPHDDEIADFVSACLRAIEQFYHDRITEAVAMGTIRAGIDARATAQTLLSLFLGLRVLTRSDPRQTALAAIIAQIRAMLD